MSRFIFGIDEAGRGPLAGPVAVAVFGVKNRFNIKDFPAGRDSKKMTSFEREYWFDRFEKEKSAGLAFFEVCFFSAKLIDRRGIVSCINRAIEQGIEKIGEKVGLHFQSPIFLDGGLRAPSRFSNQRTIIKGDEKKKVIAAASIVAKVSRDRMMFRLAKRYPLFGFEKHKGYGTFEHRRKISKLGLSPIHRKSYCKTVRTG